MHFNILLTLSTLTALSSNAAAQFPLSGINGLNALGGLGAFSQTPGPSSTPIPTLVKKPATPLAFPFPSQTPSLSTPVPKASASSGLKDSLPLGSLFGAL
ncbi:hypothetical protein N7517_001316 [Penicillium concentricum]|uniref:Uncharacterized protein n=1 Tax=Penicillium concentricum TaxID=293559 RepID=A0A9W9SRT0_9EURO|nr:uncharacterized protein N7517_001316 [Penicillium concentricum]KAJ5383405.1 hypothetical protein N7517_001316 [Penicillium concentricum]